MTPTVGELRADALEMSAIMRSAECMIRHPEISHDRLAEILTALCVAGELASRNSKGYDVASEEHGRIEVKSRILGTDGWFPRVSLTPNKMAVADAVMAVRWTPEYTFHAAVLLSRDAVRPLFEAKLQASGKQAHIAWADWVGASDAIDFTSRFAGLLS